jgi:hypothetical protein
MFTFFHKLVNNRSPISTDRQLIYDFIRQCCKSVGMTDWIKEKVEVELQ